VTRPASHAETRTLKLAAVSAGIGFPHARLAIQLTRRRRSTRTGRWHTETVYAVTDLGFDQIRPDQLTEVIRRHWHIENRLHWVRDVVFAEDHCQIRTGNGPASWLPCAASPSACTDSPAPPTSPPPAAASAATRTESLRCSHNDQINFAEALT
jgi:hypothetical protein